MSEQDKAAPVEHTICLNPVHKKTICSQNQDFYTHKQEPVAWMYTSKLAGNQRYFTRFQTELSTYKADKVWPLYTHPKEWVGLTDEERLRCEQKAEGNYFEIGRAHV